LATYLSNSKFEEFFIRDVKTAKVGEARVKKFFEWFDAFRLFKYLHYMRDNGLDDIPLIEACGTLYQYLGKQPLSDETKYLLDLRAIDKRTSYRNQWRAAFIARLSKTTAS